MAAPTKFGRFMQAQSMGGWQSPWGIANAFCDPSDVLGRLVPADDDEAFFEADTPLPRATRRTSPGVWGPADHPAVLWDEL